MNLMLSDSSLLLVTVGDRSFAAAGLRFWNSLPADVQSAPSLNISSETENSKLLCHSGP